MKEKTLAERQEEAVELFNELDNWQDKFNFLVELGQSLTMMRPWWKIPSNLITTCHSKTYFVACNNELGKITIEGESNSAIVSGLIQLLKAVFDCYPIQELQDLDINLHIATGLMDNMTEQRKATLEEMIKRIKQLC